MTFADIHLFGQHFHEGSAISEGWSTSDSISLIAVSISLVIGALAYQGVYLSKKLELRLKLFESEISTNIDYILTPTDEIFLNNSNLYLDKVTYKRTISDTSTNFDIVLLSVKSVFSDLNVDSLIKQKESTMDYLFENSEALYLDNAVIYRSFKISIRSALYNQIIGRYLSLSYHIGCFFGFGKYMRRRGR